MQDRRDQHLPDKVNTILNVILVALILVLLRVWHLAVVQYDEKVEQSRKPQQRAVFEPARRATIRDRFNVPLAVNTMKYNAAILYSQLRQIPSFAWEKGPDGKKKKRYKRREYIARLSELLGDELQLDPKHIEDLIHAKASFYYQVPFVLKEDISEKEYYRLKMLEKDWLGIHVQHLPRRSYPQGKIGADVIGYMGAINREEYERILQEIDVLEAFVQAVEVGEEPEMPPKIDSFAAATERLSALKQQAYTLNDSIGKTGAEAVFEPLLRGYRGNKVFYSDARGNFLREMPGSKEPIPGKRLLLTLSVELQEYAEKLLAQNEQIREARISNLTASVQDNLGLKQPWIKGGAIVAMDPKTGEILALASYPRFDPNDFILSGSQEVVKEKKKRIGHWLESETYLAEIWDQKRPLEREFVDREDHFYEDGVLLTWQEYLRQILPKDHAVSLELQRIATVERAIALQRHVEGLLRASGQSDARRLLNCLYREGVPFKLETPNDRMIEEKLNGDLVDHLKRQTLRHFGHLRYHYDKLLLVDLCRLCVNGEAFSEQLIEKRGKQTLADYRNACAAKGVMEEIARNMAADLFRATTFKEWRESHEKEFLKQKRMEEKASKTYQKPFVDYLDAACKSQFNLFWDRYRWNLILAFLTGVECQDPTLNIYEQHFKSWHAELEQGAHGDLSWRSAYLLLQDALQGLDGELAIAYLKTMRTFQELERPLLGRYRYLRKAKEGQLEKHLAAAFYPRTGFGYGRSQVYRQAAPQGSIFKLVTAYAALLQRYQEEPFPVKENLNPLEINDHVHRRGKEIFVGYNLDGQPIPRFYKGGRLPTTPRPLGRLDVLKALETSSNLYFALLAGDVLHSPEDLVEAARDFSFGCKTGIRLPAEIPGKIPSDLAVNRSGLYAMAIGQHSLVVTPLQTALMLSAIANGGSILQPQILKMHIESPCQLYPFSPETKWQLSMPPMIRDLLLDGMRRVVMRTHEDSLKRLSRIYRDHPEAISDYIDLKDELIGKTSTAEMMENLSLDAMQGTHLYKHVWFGGISFTDVSLQDPELVVVVYLRFGTYGKEAAPIAAQIVKKWREIVAFHQKDKKVI